MPEISAVLIAILTAAIALGALVGWIVRAHRCAQEKAAVNDGWQNQLEAQRSEHARLLGQNKNLMEQVSHLQASGKDATNRARELSDALKETFERRDQLQRELKEIRSNLERAVSERDRLQTDMQTNEARGDSARVALKEKDDRIFRLSHELESWQNRLPPLIERYRQRDQEANQLEDELALARARIRDLEELVEAGETRIEPVDRDSLGDALDASNDPTTQTRTDLDELSNGETAGIGEPDGEDPDEVEAAPDEAEAPQDSLDDGEEMQAFLDEHDEVVAAPDEAEAPQDSLDDGEEMRAPFDEHVEVPETKATPDVEAEEFRQSAEVTEISGYEAGGLRDNLRLIKGIGPAIEKTLNELGIFRFHQIAEMSEYDIDRIARRLKGFRSRIYREDWIGQARELQLKKSGT